MSIIPTPPTDAFGAFLETARTEARGFPAGRGSSQQVLACWDNLALRRRLTVVVGADFGTHTALYSRAEAVWRRYGAVGRIQRLYAGREGQLAFACQECRGQHPAMKLFEV